MYCEICRKWFPSECTCADRDDRLVQLQKIPNFAVRICKVCNLHADMCKCKDGPVTIFVNNGEQINMPESVD